MSLCAKCRPLIPERVERQSRDSSGRPPTPTIWRESTSKDAIWIMHSSWDSFCSSLDQNCPACWSLWRHIRSSPLATPDKERHEAFQSRAVKISHDPSESSYETCIGLEGVGAKDGEVRFRIEERLFDEEPWRVYPTPTLRSVTDCIDGWLKCCLKYHHDCKQITKAKRRAKSSSPLPTRLVDVGDRQSNQWRIVLTEGDFRRYGKYCALSHRWSDHTPKLSRQNLEKYKGYQDHGQFPQDYEDVMALCRAISVRYLWIDSLCILQDSAEDFKQEAASMMDIYANAILTFSICWDCSEDGFFSQRNRGPLPRPIEMPHRASSANLLNLLYDRIVWHVGHLFPRRTRPPTWNSLQFGQQWHGSVTDALVNTRGWVLQERTLSPRIVYIGNDQLYWECHSCRISETEQYQGVIGKEARHYLHFHHRRLPTALPHQLIQYFWPETIETYTNLELTYEGDRLIAISGLARRFSQGIQGDYLAGVWTDYWIYDLLWDPASAHKGYTDLSRCFASAAEKPSSIPSWSWAAFPGPVKLARPWQMRIDYADVLFPLGSRGYYETDKAMPLAVLTKSMITPPGSDPYGHFEHASLECRCYSIPLSFEMVKDLAKFKEVSTSNGVVQLSLEESNGEDGPVGLPGIKLVALRSGEEGNAVDVCFSRPWDSSLPCFFIPLYIDKRGSAENNQDRRPIRGIIVQGQISGPSTPGEAKECQIQTFFRIGTLMESESVMDGISRVMANTISQKGCRSSEQRSDEKDVEKFESTLKLLADHLSSYSTRTDWSNFKYFEVDWTQIRLV